MFKALLIVSFLFMSVAFASVPGEQSLECHPPDSDTMNVYLDLWMIGHPMGGLTSFEGIMSANGEKAIVQINVEPLYFYGSTTDFSQLNFKLMIGDLMGKGLNIDVTTELRQQSQITGPMPGRPGPWTSQPEICRWTL